MERKLKDMEDDTSHATIDRKGRAMERKSCRLSEMEDDISIANTDITEKKRFSKVPPAHFIFEIESFSSLLETKVEKYETKDFVSGGYKWRMVLYPNGKTKEDGDRHISLFLAMREPDDVSIGWEVNVTVTFFVFDGIGDRYLAVQDADRIDWRFHKMKMEWGFIKFLSRDTLRDPSKGFLVDDCCMFGVEVFVIKRPGEGESLSFVKEPANGLQTWTINDFSKLNKNVQFSNMFTVEGRNWKLQLYPRGDSNASGTHLSLYLGLDDSETLQTRRILYVKCLLRVKDDTNGNHYERTAECEDWFDASRKLCGFSDFMMLTTLKDQSKGYLENDCLIIETEFMLVSVVKDFSEKKERSAFTKAFFI